MDDIMIDRALLSKMLSRMSSTSDAMALDSIMGFIDQYVTEARREGAREGWNQGRAYGINSVDENGKVWRNHPDHNPYATPPSAPGGK